MPSETSVAAATGSPQGDVTDEKIGLPPYPGAKEIEHSRLKLRSGMSETFSVHYRSSDSPTQIAEYYRAEGVKVGTLEEAIVLGDQLKTVSIVRGDGSRSIVQAAIDGKGNTIISMHRSFPFK